MTLQEDKNTEPFLGVAPADARPHAPWPVWKKAVGYLLLAALSFAAIWFVDVKVHRPALLPPGQDEAAI
jgi:hypothetical protein